MGLPEPEPSDLDLLSRYARGEAAAMDLLVDRHAGRVYAFVLRFVGDAALAEDLTQEVWLRVLRAASGFEGRARFSTWLFTVARSVCLDHARGARRRSERLPEAEAPVAELVGGEEGLLLRLEQRELAAHALEALGALPEPQREAFLLREEGFGLQEIAELQEVSRDTVKSRLRYALQGLRRILRARLGEGANRGL